MSLVSAHMSRSGVPVARGSLRAEGHVRVWASGVPLLKSTCFQSCFLSVSEQVSLVVYIRLSPWHVFAVE